MFLIVVLYRSAEAVDALWDCLRAQHLTGWRLVLVDNDPTDGAGARMMAHGDDRVSRIVNTANMGFAKAVNQGLQAAAVQGAQRFLLLNPDTSFTADFLADLDERWTALGAQVIAPRVMYENEPDRAWYAGGHLETAWAFTNKHDPYDKANAADRLVEFASGCCLGMTRAVLDRLGLLDESFFVYWEDADFCLRLKQAGQPIQYLDQPFLSHQAGASSGGEFSPSYARLYYRCYAQLLRKHFGIRTAARTMIRIVLKQSRRAGRPEGSTRRMARAMLLGLITQRRNVPRLRTTFGPVA